MLIELELSLGEAAGLHDFDATAGGSLPPLPFSVVRAAVAWAAPKRKHAILEDP
jgi:hypothetical protein